MDKLEFDKGEDENKKKEPGLTLSNPLPEAKRKKTEDATATYSTTSKDAGGSELGLDVDNEGRIYLPIFSSTINNDEKTSCVQGTFDFTH